MTKAIDKTNQAVHQLIKKFTEAWNIHDVKMFAALFAEDADFTNVFGQKAHGKTAIEACHAPIFLTVFKNSFLTATDIFVRFIKPDLAAVDVTWEMTGATDFKGNPWNNRKGIMNLIVQNEGGEWLILIMHNMDLPVAASSLQKN